MNDQFILVSNVHPHKEMKHNGHSVSVSGVIQNGYRLCVGQIEDITNILINRTQYMIGVIVTILIS